MPAGVSQRLTGTVIQIGGIRLAPLPNTRSCLYVPKLTPIEYISLTDDFDDNSTDAAKWSVGQFYPSATTSGTLAEQNGRVEITPAASVAGNKFTGYSSVNTFDLTGKAIYAKIMPQGAVPSGQQVYLAFGANAPGSQYQVLINGANLEFYKWIATTFTLLFWTTYSSANHAWLRLRHGGADDRIYLDAAPSSAADPPLDSEYANIGSVARDTSVSVTAGTAAFGTGTYTSTASPVAVYFDGFNTATTAGASNNIVGSTSLAFSPAATLLGQGAITGSSTLALSPSATLLGAGAVSGSSALTFSPSASLSGTGALTGSSTLTFSPSGTVTGKGALTATTALTFVPTATLLGRGAVAGSSSITFTPSGTIAAGNLHPFRYYRLYMTAAGNGGGGVSLAEIELATSAAGADTTSGQTFTASTTFSGSSPANAYDDNTASWWASDFSTGLPDWLKADYGSTSGNWKAINELRITARDTNGPQAPADFKLQGSDDNVSWTDLLSQTGVSFTDGETKTFAVTSGAPQTLTGSTSLTFSAQGSITGIGALLGTSALTFAGAASVTGRGQLSGSALLSFTLAAELEHELWTEQPPGDGSWNDNDPDTGAWSEVASTGSWNSDDPDNGIWTVHPPNTGTWG